MPDGNMEHGQLGLQTRLMPMSSIDKAARTAEVTWTTGAPVRRYDYIRDRYYNETLSLDPSHVRMGRLQSGSAPVLDSHSGWGLSSVLGVVERASINPPTAGLRFSKREEVQPVFADVEDGILKNVSVGYRVYRYEMIPPSGMDGDWTYRAVDWEPMELSIVPIPADPGATVRANDKGVLTQCAFISLETRAAESVVALPAAAAAGSSNTTTTRKEPHMDQPTGQVTAPAAQPNAGAPNVEEVRAAAAQAERERNVDINTRCDALGLSAEFRNGLINSSDSIETCLRKIVDEAARKQAATPTATRAEVIEDERTKVRTAMASALAHRANPRGDIPNNGAGDFRYMSLLRMGEEMLSREGHRVRGMAPFEIATRALHSTSDFANVLLDAANKRLRTAYAENTPSYQRWARRAPNAPDFKNINVIQLSNAPDLQKVLEGGEFKQGAMSDGKETYTVSTYGRIIGISRQSIINDDMAAFDRIPVALAMAGRRLENRTVYGLFETNAAMSDTGALFNATAVTTAGGHANYSTGTGSALSLTQLGTSRAAMRIQKGYQNEELNIAPAFLIVPAALEQLAYQYTSSQYVPASSTSVNEFRQGGRTQLEPIVEAYLDGLTNGTTAWYLAADPNQVDTVEWCYLDGNEGLYLESQVGFDVDGIRLKARLDFACAPIDWRGLYRNKGA